MRISDWSSDVCSSDLLNHAKETAHARHVKGPAESRRRRARCKARRTAEIQAQGGVQADGGIHDGETARGVCGHQVQGTAGQERLSALEQSRSAERRGGGGWWSTCRSRWWTANEKKTTEKKRRK